MNRHTKILVVTLACFLAIWIPMAFKRPIPGRSYTVRLTEERWNAMFQHIQNDMVIMRTSTIPGSEIAAAQDSTIKDMQVIQGQLIPQMQADTLVKPKR